MFQLLLVLTLLSSHCLKSGDGPARISAQWRASDGTTVSDEFIGGNGSTCLNVETLETDHQATNDGAEHYGHIRAETLILLDSKKSLISPTWRHDVIRGKLKEKI